MRVKDYTIRKSVQEYLPVLRARVRAQTPLMGQTKQFLRLFEPAYRKGMTVLDAGCAAGHFRTAFEIRGFDLRYFGLDAEREFLAVGRAHFGSSARLVCGDVFDAPRLFRGRFGAVVGYMLLEHVPDPLALLTRIAACAEEWIFLRLLLGPQRHEIKKFEDPAHPESFMYYNIVAERDLRRTLEGLGFRDVHFEEDDFVEELSTKYQGPDATWVHHGLQIMGNVVLPWRHVRARRR